MRRSRSTEWPEIVGGNGETSHDLLGGPSANAVGGEGTLSSVAINPCAWWLFASGGGGRCKCGKPWGHAAGTHS